GSIRQTSSLRSAGSASPPYFCANAGVARTSPISNPAAAAHIRPGFIARPPPVARQLRVDPVPASPTLLRKAESRTRRNGETVMSSLDPIPYTDAQLRAILQRVKTIAMVGASSNWNRPSYFVMKYLQGKGYRVIPVNPGIAGQRLLGETAYASLRDIPEPVDMVDVFRPARDAPAIVDDAIAIGAKIVWMQLGIRND